MFKKYLGLLLTLTLLMVGSATAFGPDGTGSFVIPEALKFPGISTATRDALTPAAGDLIYDSTTSNFQGYDGSGWNDLDGGIPDTILYEATVGTGGDYATLATALAANKYKLKFVSDVSLAQSHTLSANTEVYMNLDGYTLTFSDYRINVNSTGFLAIFNGKLDLNGGPGVSYISATSPTSLHLFDLIVECNQTAGTSGLATTGLLERVIFNVNTAFSASALGGLYFNGIARDIRLNMNNAGAYYTIFGGEDMVLQNVEIGGTAPTNANGVIVASGVVDNVKVVVAQNVIIKVTGGGDSVLTNAKSHTGNLTLDVRPNGSTGMRYTIKDSELYALTAGTTVARELNLQNVVIDQAVTLNDKFDDAKITDCRFNNGLTIQGDNNTIAGTTVGTGTITVSATADNTSIIGATTASAIVDNGTNTNIWADGVLQVSDSLALGTSSPSAQLHMQGNLSTALTNTATSSGTGNRDIASTAHGLNVGDSVQLPSGAAAAAEIFTVATVTDADNFVVDSDLTNAITTATAYSDPDLFRVDNGEAVEKFSIDKSGIVSLAQVTAPGTTTDKLYNVAGALTWNGTDLTGGGGGSNAVSTKTGAYTATASDYMILCDATSADVTITLPAAASNSGLELTIKKIDSSANDCIIDPNATETIDDDSASLSWSSQYEAYTIISDGTEWWIK